MRVVWHHWRDHKDSNGMAIGVQFGRDIVPGFGNDHGCSGDCTTELRAED
jgi:hypothetical protein